MWDPETPVRIDAHLRALVRAAVIHGSPVVVAPAAAPLLEEIEATATVLTSEHAGHPPGAIPGLAAARELYRSFGMDPTHTRPSSEALLRRVLQGKGLPRILNAVDVCNLCAVRHLLPIGLYDAAGVRPPVVLRRGLPGESYPGIRKDDVHLEGRPVLADASGPFGNPTSDSLRTSVAATTRAIVMVIFAPASYARGRLEAHATDAAAAMARHLAGGATPVVTRVSIVPVD